MEFMPPKIKDKGSIIRNMQERNPTIKEPSALTETNLSQIEIFHISYFAKNACLRFFEKKI